METAWKAGLEEPLGAEDRDLYRVVAEVVRARLPAAVRVAHVFEIRRHLAPEDPGVVGDDGGAGHELRLELPEVVEVVFLGGVGEDEVAAPGQEGDGPQGG